MFGCVIYSIVIILLYFVSKKYQRYQRTFFPNQEDFQKYKKRHDHHIRTSWISKSLQTVTRRTLQLKMPSLVCWFFRTHHGHCYCSYLLLSFSIQVLASTKHSLCPGEPQLFPYCSAPITLWAADCPLSGTFLEKLSKAALHKVQKKVLKVILGILLQMQKTLLLESHF